jgi:site-specific DNA recombinase
MSVTSQIEPSPTAKRAVIYLRVSTRDQAERGGEIEGFSIPAQREACLRKATALGASVVEEFVDAGQSARSADRPSLKRMVSYVQNETVDFVIFHKVDRLARSRADDIELTLALTAAGAQLVSCSENIDETPSGMLLHGIMSSIAEFYSRNLATEAKKGMLQKAKSGGTPTLAPFGYLNTAIRDEHGREIRTVVTDADRSQWVPWIFERYATGEWTVGMIQEELASLGVTTFPRPNRPAGPLAKSYVAKVLQNRYYVGVVVFDGVEYPGRHDPLVSEELFAKCQRIREGRVQSQEKPRVRTHYLKGSLYCGECGEPLTYEVTRNRLGNYYEYFYCIGRQVRKNGCGFKATQAPLLERKIEDHWASVEVTDEFVSQIRQIVWKHIGTVMPAQDQERWDAEARLARLSREADKLLQAFYADAITTDQLRAEQTRIAASRAAAEQLLARTRVAEERVKAAAERCCDLLVRAHEHYLAHDDQGRRELNQAVFRKIYVHDDDVVGSDLTPAFHKLLHEDLTAILATEARKHLKSNVRTTDLFLLPRPVDAEQGSPLHPSGLLRPRGGRDGHVLNPTHRGRRERPSGSLPWERKNPSPQSEDQGSNVLLLVGLTGFEPAASSSRTKRATKLRHSPIADPPTAGPRADASIPEPVGAPEIGIRRAAGRRSSGSPRGGRRLGSACRGWCRGRRRRAARTTRGRRERSPRGAGGDLSRERCRGRSWWSAHRTRAGTPAHRGCARR